METAKDIAREALGKIERQFNHHLPTDDAPRVDWMRAVGGERWHEWRDTIAALRRIVANDPLTLDDSGPGEAGDRKAPGDQMGTSPAPVPDDKPATGEKA